MWLGPGGAPVLAWLILLLPEPNSLAPATTVRLAVESQMAISLLDVRLVGE